MRVSTALYVIISIVIFFTMCKKTFEDFHSLILQLNFLFFRLNYFLSLAFAIASTGKKSSFSRTIKWYGPRPRKMKLYESCLFLFVHSLVAIMRRISGGTLSRSCFSRKSQYTMSQSLTFLSLISSLQQHRLNRSNRSI
jgi:hypothetical protein